MAISAGKMAEPACPLHGVVPSCASMLSMVKAPAIAAPAGLTAPPSISMRAAPALPTPNSIGATRRAMADIGVVAPTAATPIVSRNDRRNVHSTGSGRSS